MQIAICSPKRTSIADAIGGDDPGLFGGGGGGGGGEGGRHGGQRRRVLHGHVLHWDAGVALGLHVWNEDDMLVGRCLSRAACH